MKQKKSILLVLILSLFACNHNSSMEGSSSTSSQESSKQELTQLDLVQNLKTKLLTFDDVVSKCSYETEQEDYYGISINVSESGNKTLYLDNYLVTDFSQTIGSDTLQGRKEIGISVSPVAGSKIYEVSFYGTGDEGNEVTYYENSEDNRKAIFNIGFANEYINTILNTTIAYYNVENAKLSLTTNFDQVDLDSDGAKVLQYRFISYASDGRTKNEEVQRDDTIVIENGKIVSCETVMLYSLLDGVNYQYMNKTSSFEYHELSSFNGTKLDPKDFE